MAVATAVAVVGSTVAAVADFREARARAVEDFREVRARTAVDRIVPPRQVTLAALHGLALISIVRGPAPIPIGRQPEVRVAPRKSLATANGTRLPHRTLPVLVLV
jgi:hypothetical protein